VTEAFDAMDAGTSMKILLYCATAAH